ncbi:MAG: ABC transporter permease [Iamia sp.]
MNVLVARGWRSPVLNEVRLLISWSRRELSSRYRQSAGHLVWSALQPLGVIVVYAVVFHAILKVRGDGLPYLSFMVVGLMSWRYFANGVSQATCLVDQSHVIGRVYFRREIVPLSGCLTGLIDLGVGSVAMVAVATLQGIGPKLTLLALPLVYLPLILYSAAAAVFLSTITVFLRDVGHALPTIQQMLFLATPIMYPVSQLPPELRFLGTVNPIAQLTESARDVTLRGAWPDPLLLGGNTLAGGLILTGAIVYLRSIEHRIVDIG